MIALIGGSGFIGTRLRQHLENQESRFLIVDSAPPSKYSGVFLDKDISADEFSNTRISDVQSIINLAAEHRDNVSPHSLYSSTNINGAKNICKFAVLNNVKTIVFTSSVAVFGFAQPNTDESGSINYFNEYGRTKWEAEKVYRNWQSESPEERCLVIVRPTVVFGEGNRGNVYNLFRQIASGKFLMFGSGDNRKSMAYVENVAAFLEHSLAFGPGLHVYNYVDKPDFTMNELVSIVRKTLFGKTGVGLRLPAFLGIGIGYIADAVAKVSGRSLPVSSIRVKKFMGTTQFETSIAKTGFVPPVALEEGLRRTLQYEFLEDNSEKQTFETE